MTGRPWLQPAAADRHALQAINDFQSETAEITGAADPSGTRATVAVLAVMVAAGLGLAAVVPLDRIVQAPGRVVSQAPTLVVQPLETAIIRSLDVREGQVVRRDQLLARLDPTMTAADAAQLEQQVASLAAAVDRLQAERDGRAFVPADAREPYQELQATVFRHRQAERQSKLANFDQRLATTQATLTRTQAEVTHYRTRLGLLEEVEQMRMTLHRNQTGSRLNALLASDTRVEVARSLTAAEGNVNAAAHELEALKAEREGFLQQWQGATMQELVTHTVELGRAREELAKASKRRDLVELRAIEDAVVLEVAPVSVGSVLTTAQTLMTLVPAAAPLEVEASVVAADQGFIKVGDPVEVKLDAYRYIEHGTAKGVVRTISEDSFAARDQNAVGAPRYYKARVALESVALRGVPADFRLVPGMTLTADIVVGARTILSYLLDRVLRSVSEGMREP